MSALHPLRLRRIQCLDEQGQGAMLGEEEGHWIQFQILCKKQKKKMCIGEVIVHDKVMKLRIA